MGLFLYPENYEEPVVDPPVKVLTPAEREAAKNWIKNKVNTEDRPVEIRAAIDFIQNEVLYPQERYIKDEVVEELILEVRKEFGYPGQYRNDIAQFAESDPGYVTVTSMGHGFVEGQSVEIILTTNYDGVYVISDVTTDTFDIEAVWVADDATGVLLEG